VGDPRLTDDPLVDPAASVDFDPSLGLGRAASGDRRRLFVLRVVVVVVVHQLPPRGLKQPLVERVADEGAVRHPRETVAAGQEQPEALGEKFAEVGDHGSEGRWRRGRAVFGIAAAAAGALSTKIRLRTHLHDPQEIKSLLC